LLQLLIGDAEAPDRRRSRDETPGVVFVRDGRIQSLLHHAARAKAVAVLQYLTGTYPALDVGARDRWQRTPMHWAVLSGDEETVRTLTESAMTRHRAWVSRHEGSALKATTSHDFNNAETAPPFTVRTAAQLKRLSQQKTSLPYETLSELATRMHGPSSTIAVLVAEISLLIN
jgi:ankyrin repeat protein